VALVRVFTYAERPDLADRTGEIEDTFAAFLGRRDPGPALAQASPGTARASAEDGDYVVPGALVPVSFADGHGVCVEPNVWMRHAAAQ